jgi:hypothetical protein
MAPKVGGKLFPGDSVWGGMSGRIRIPPSGCRSLKSSCSIQDLLSVVTLTGCEHFQHCLQPIFSFKWISDMSEHRRVVTHKPPVLVARRRWLHRWVIDLGLQVCHGVGQVLEELGLCLQELLHSGIHLYWLGCSSCWLINF